MAVAVAVAVAVVAAMVMAMEVVVGVAGVDAAGVDINDCKLVMDQVVPKN